MKKSDGVDFETWFDILREHVQERTGVTFRDPDAVSEDYESNRDVHDVIDEIAEDYGPA